MKTQRKLIVILVLIITTNIFSQTRSEQRQKPKEKKVIKKVDKTNEKINDANETFNNTTDSIDETVESTKKTVKKLKDAFFGSKKAKAKNKNSKELITIQIPKIDYGDKLVTKLYQKISTLKGVKKVSKSYADGSMRIQVDYKENADSLWMLVDEELRQEFEVKEMCEKNILLQLEAKDSNKKGIDKN